MALNQLTVADEVWIATAMLLWENPQREVISFSEIVDRIRREFGRVRPGVAAHISSHCIADLKPQPGRRRMLVRDSRGEYHLFRPGDPYHPDREGGKTKPDPKDVPTKYRFLLDWYEKEYGPSVKLLGPRSLLLQMEPGASGQNDVSSTHDRYLVEAYREGHSDASPKHSA